MPNWCNNRATIIGSPSAIKKIKEAVESEEFFQHFLPIPEVLKESDHTASEADKANIEKQNIIKTGYPGWYEYCKDTWGTKWDISDANILLDEKHQIEFEFLSAWSPPISGYKNLEELLKVRIEAYYYEPGADFCGEYIDGKENTTNTQNASDKVKDIFATLIEELNEEEE